MKINKRIKLKEKDNLSIFEVGLHYLEEISKVILSNEFKEEIQKDSHSLKNINLLILELKKLIEILVKSIPKVEEKNYSSSIEHFNFKGRGIILTIIHEAFSLLKLLKEHQSTKNTFMYQNIMKTSWDSQFQLKIESIKKRFLCLNKFMEELNKCENQYNYEMDINSFPELIRDIDISEFMNVGEQVKFNNFNLKVC
jgi:hypothetical protein